MTILVVAVATSLTQAQISEPILGIPLGKTFEPRRCEGQRHNWCSIDSIDKNSRYFNLMPPDTDSSTGLPTWIRREKLNLFLNADGVVDKFYVTTLGPSVQDRVVESISGRFGKPATLDKQSKQNSMGVTIEAVSALWQTSDAVITHTGSQINSCTVFFYTVESYATALARMQQQKQRDKL